MSPPFASLRRDATCIALAAAAGLGIGWLDLHTTEVTVTILALLLAGLLLGLLEPRGAWRWAALLALGLPIMALVAGLLRVHTAEPIRLDPRVALAALAFALAGCYSGVVVRRIAERFTVPE
jgi:MFS family permease